MGDKLDRIFEYRVLLTKRDELNIPLSASECARLERLKGQLATEVATLDDRDPFTMLATPLPAQFVIDGQFKGGVVRNVSAAGLAVVTAEPPELGRALILHVSEPAHGIEYTFPCRVVSRVLSGVTSIGLAFEGVPTQTRVGGRRSGVWRSDPTPTEDDRPTVRRTNGG